MLDGVTSQASHRSGDMAVCATFSYALLFYFSVSPATSRVDFARPRFADKTLRSYDGTVLEVDKSDANDTRARSRRAVPDAALPPLNSTLIRGLITLTKSVGVNDRGSCVPVYDGLFTNCTHYTTQLLNETFVLPLSKSLRAYRTIANSTCPWDACTPLNCSLLKSTVRSASVLERNALELMKQIIAGFCIPESSATTGNSVLRTATVKLQTFLDRLNTAVPLTNRAFLNCSAHHASGSPNAKVLASQLKILFREVSKVTKTFSDGLFSDASLPVRKVMVELPRRLDDALNNISRSRLNVSPNKTYVVRSTTFLLCSSLFPDAVIRPCPWLCQNISAFVELRDLFQSENNVTPPSNDEIVQLFRYLSRQCSGHGAWTHCLDRACNNANQVCRNGTVESARARQAGGGPCFKPACPFPLHNTSNGDHWSSDAQDVLKAGYHATYLLVDNTTQYNPRVLPCGVKCGTVTFTKDDEDTVRILIGVFGWLLFAISLFAVLTFYLNRIRINKYPTKVLLYLNVTLAIGNFTNLLQFFTDKDAYTCYEDGTLRMGEPMDSSDNGSRVCTFTFIVVFYCLMASLFWWLALTHAWYVTFDRLDMKGGHPEDNNYFMKFYHLIAWPVPAIFTIVMLSKRYVDGFPLYGICYTTNVDAWFNYLSVPIVVVGFLGLPFLIKGIKQLFLYQRSIKHMRSFRRRPSEQKLRRSDSSLRTFMMKLAFIIVMSFINLQVQFAVGLYMKVKWKSWQQQSEDHILCVLTACTPDISHCASLPRPSLAAFVMTPLAIMLEGIVLCLWAFTHETWHAWQEGSRRASQFFRRMSSHLPVQRQTTNGSMTTMSISFDRSAGRKLSTVSSSDSQLARQGTSRCTGIDFVEGANAQPRGKQKKRIQKMTSVEFNLHYGVSKEESDAAKRTFFSDGGVTESTSKSSLPEEPKEVVFSYDGSPKAQRQNDHNADWPTENGIVDLAQSPGTRLKKLNTHTSEENVFSAVRYQKMDGKLSTTPSDEDHEQDMNKREGGKSDFMSPGSCSPSTPSTVESSMIAPTASRSQAPESTPQQLHRDPSSSPDNRGTESPYHVPKMATELLTVEYADGLKETSI